MNENDLLHCAQELKAQGKSIRQIAAELNISKSKVFRWLSTKSDNENNSLAILHCAAPINDETTTNCTNKKNMENQNDNYRLEREIALKKMQLDHDLELRKLDHQEKELELRKREIELKHLEKDSLTRQQQIEENKIKHQLKKWSNEEMQLFESFDYDEIEMSLSSLTKKVKILLNLAQQIKEHIAAYGYDPEEQIYYSNLKQVITFLFEVQETEGDELEEDDNPSEIEISYEWPEDYMEYIENLGNFEFL